MESRHAKIRSSNCLKKRLAVLLVQPKKPTIHFEYSVWYWTRNRYSSTLLLLLLLFLYNENYDNIASAAALSPHTHYTAVYVGQTHMDKNTPFSFHLFTLRGKGMGKGERKEIKRKKAITGFFFAASSACRYRIRRLQRYSVWGAYCCMSVPEKSWAVWQPYEGRGEVGWWYR